MKIQQIMGTKENESVNGLVFMLTSKNKRSFNNKPGNFVTMELSDDSGKIQAIKWEDAEEVIDSISVGDIVKIDGVISEYRGNKQIIVDNITVESDDYNKIDFMPKVKDLEGIINGFEKMVEELKKKCDSENEGYLEVLDNFLVSEYYDKLKEWPAAIKFHHEKLGGLMEHTFNVARHVYFASLREPRMNMYLATLGAMLHDIGKVLEYSFESGAVQMTRSGILFGHKVLGMEIVKEFSRESSLTREEENLLLHIIASHHGKQEYGAITVPKIPEAVLVHHADLMDAECYKVLDGAENIGAGEFGYSDRYKGYIYSPLLEQEEDEADF